MAGLFVSFEGIDGSGKSTQARRLAERLRAEGHDVQQTREPGGSPGAEEIRRLVLEGDPDRWSAETEILLFTAARRDHLEKTIRPALARGAVVICDRFADSTRIFQGITRGDLTETVDRLHDLMIGLEPDLTLLVDLDPATGLARASAGRMVFSRWSRRAAVNSRISVSADQRSGSPSSTRRRISSAPGLPPGSRVRTTSCPTARSCSASRRACVDLPDPSIPSNETNRPAIHEAGAAAPR